MVVKVEYLHILWVIADRPNLLYNVASTYGTNSVHNFKMNDIFVKRKNRSIFIFICAGFKLLHLFVTSSP
jgi:hypothetical protein